MTIRPSEQLILDTFNQGYPTLSAFHAKFLDNEEDRIDAMPRPRFGIHDYDRVFTHDQHVEVFGLDTSHRWHPVIQHSVVLDMLRRDHQGIHPRRAENLGWAAVTHDMGEPWTGDPLPGEPRDIVKERQKRNEAIAATDPERAEEILSRVVPILEDEDHPDFSIFGLSERIGYFRTGITAAKIYLNPNNVGHLDLSPKQRRVAAIIATDVWERNYPKLSRLQRSSSAAGHLLADGADIVKIAIGKFAEEDPDWHKIAVDRVNKKT